MEKRGKDKGQATIFAIIAIVLVASILLIYPLYNTGFFDRFLKGGFSSDLNNIEKNVQNCVDSSLERVIVINSLQGGYYFVSEPSVYYFSNDSLLSRNIPYYIDKEYKVPSTQTLRDEISSGLLSEISACLDSEQFVDGPIEIGNALVDIDFSNYKADVKILNDRVNVKIYFSVNVNFNETNYLLNEFSSDYKTNYLALYRLASNISEIQKQYKGEICLTCIDAVVKDNDAQLFNQEFYEDNNASYTLIYNIFKEYPREEKIEVYSFAHKFYQK